MIKIRLPHKISVQNCLCDVTMSKWRQQQQDKHVLISTCSIFNASKNWIPRKTEFDFICRQKRNILHCEQTKWNLIKIELEIREFLIIIYTVHLYRPVNVAVVQDCWCDVTMSKWRQLQETRAKREVLYKSVLQTKQIMRPKIEYRTTRN